MTTKNRAKVRRGEIPFSWAIGHPGESEQRVKEKLESKIKEEDNAKKSSLKLRRAVDKRM